MDNDNIRVEYNPAFNGQILKIYIPNEKLLSKKSAFWHIVKCLWKAWRWFGK